MRNTPGISAVTPEDRPDERGPSLRSQAGRSGRFATAPSRRESRFAKEVKQGSYDLVQPSAEDWKNQEPEVVEEYYRRTFEGFFVIVNDYLTQAKSATDRYKSSSLSHRRWRFWTIIATGILAAINVCAALHTLNTPLWGTTSLSQLLTAVAALYAAGLTVAGNVENFLNMGEQAAGFREARDLLLSRYREYSSKWLYHVEAYGKTPKACMNAGWLYRELVDSDREVLRKIKQLTEPQGQPGDKLSTAGRH